MIYFILMRTGIIRLTVPARCPVSAIEGGYIRYPNGIGELRDYCHEKGLLFGFLDGAGKNRLSFNTAKESAGLVAMGYNQKNNGGFPQKGVGGIVDLAKDKSYAWVENNIIKMIEYTKVDMFRLDFKPYIRCAIFGQYA